MWQAMDGTARLVSERQAMDPEATPTPTETTGAAHSESTNGTAHTQAGANASCQHESLSLLLYGRTTNRCLTVCGQYSSLICGE